MSEEHPHPVLAQLPLTVSPFLNLPTATPLPYSYKSLPSTLPPSVTDPAPPQNPEDTAMQGQQQQQPHPPAQAAYVVSQSGHAAHPDSIIASCRALQEHLTRLQEDARATIAKWEAGIRERELAEKRRVAPGWLDVDAPLRMLVPERADAHGHGESPQPSLLDQPVAGPERTMEEAGGAGRRDEGEELDRVFGGLSMR